MLNILIAVLIVLLLFSLVMLFISRKTYEKQQLKKRVAALSGIDISLQNTLQQDKKRPEPTNEVAERLRQLVKDVAVRIDSIKKSNDFDFKMQQAAWPLLGTEFQLIILGISAFVGLIVGILTLNIPSACFAFIVSTLVCLLVLHFRIKRRQAAFANQLGDMLTMIANAMRAGFSFPQALEHIATEMDDPVRFEVNRVLRDISLGAQLDESLNNMVRRMESADFNLVVAAVLIQRQVGGSLAQVLDTISDTINDRIRMRREITSLTSQGRLSGIILACLPFALGIFIYIASPSYLEPLFTEQIGRIAIVVALVFIIIGGLVIKKIVDIEI